MILALWWLVVLYGLFVFNKNRIFPLGDINNGKKEN